MAISLASAVENLCRCAGWKSMPPDDDGVYHFLLDGGLDLDLHSPDDRNCIISTDLGPAPADDAVSAEDEFVRLGNSAAAVMRVQRSILSLHDGRLALWRRISLDASAEDFNSEVRQFLNDQSWWRGRLDDSNANLSGSSLFSFDATGWMPGKLIF